MWFPSYLILLPQNISNSILPHETSEVSAWHSELPNDVWELWVSGVYISQIYTWVTTISRLAQRHDSRLTQHRNTHAFNATWHMYRCLDRMQSILTTLCLLYVDMSHSVSNLFTFISRKYYAIRFLANIWLFKMLDLYALYDLRHIKALLIRLTIL